MPELPEVQTIVDDLNRKIKGDTITGFWTNWKKSIKMPVGKFEKEIKGKKILSAGRVGKNILLCLAGDKTIIAHLRMTGVLIVKSPPKADQPMAEKILNPKNSIKTRLSPPPHRRIPQSRALHKHIHHIFYLKSGKTLEFSDVRKFGSLELVGTGKEKESKSFKKLGTDALSHEFTFRKFNEILDERKTKIKQFLMDQAMIAGIGNIYANEILFAAGILPTRPAHEINAEERKKLFHAIKKILKYAIKMRGTSISDYRDASGERGSFQKVLKVYQRAGKKCVRCGTIVQREIIGQRGTFYCPKCQK